MTTLYHAADRAARESIGAKGLTPNAGIRRYTLQAPAVYLAESVVGAVRWLPVPLGADVWVVEARGLAVVKDQKGGAGCWSFGIRVAPDRLQLMARDDAREAISQGLDDRGWPSDLSAGFPYGLGPLADLRRLEDVAARFTAATVDKLDRRSNDQMMVRAGAWCFTILDTDGTVLGICGERTVTVEADGTVNEEQE